MDGFIGIPEEQLTGIDALLQFVRQLGVVFGAVWSTMQTGPVARRISEYYKNNPTQS